MNEKHLLAVVGLIFFLAGVAVVLTSFFGWVGFGASLIVIGIIIAGLSQIDDEPTTPTQRED